MHTSSSGSITLGFPESAPLGHALLHEFTSSLAVGSVGEQLAVEWIYRIPELNERYTPGAEGTVFRKVTDDKAYQTLDIDYVVLHADRPHQSIEIKTDTYESGNIFIEYMSNKKWKTPGCFLKSKADYIHYYYPFAGIYLEIPTVQAQLWFVSVSGSICPSEWKQVWNKDKSGYKQSVGWAVNLERFVEEVSNMKGFSDQVRRFEVPKLKKPKDKTLYEAALEAGLTMLVNERTSGHAKLLRN